MTLKIQTTDGIIEKEYPLEIESIDLSEQHIIDIDLSPLSSCIMLQKLDLSFNQIDTINLSPIKACSHLEALILGNNKLKSIDLTPLNSCINLGYLDLTVNRLSSIDLTPLRNCSNLEAFFLGTNPLISIDLSPISECTNLAALSMSFCRFTSIDFSPLRQCIRLRILFVSHNQFRELDLTPLRNLNELVELRIGNNRISELDISSLFEMPELNEFEVDAETFLHTNRIPHEPNKIPQALRGFVAHGLVSIVIEPTFRDAYCKLLIIGNSRTGKSTLLRRICEKSGAEYGILEGSTRGVTTTQFTIPMKEQDGIYFVRAWDFAGQIEYAHIHHLFFSTKALYFFLFKPDSPDEIGLEEWHSTFEYQSRGEGLFVPIRTHLKFESLELQEINDRLWDERKKRIMGRLQVLAEKSSVKPSIIEIDSTNDEGILLLMDKLPDLIELSGVIPIPDIEDWKPINKRIAASIKTCKDNKELGIFDREQIQEILKQYNVPIPSDLGRILRYMHDSGILVSLNPLSSNAVESKVLLNPDIASKVMHRLHLIAKGSEVRGLVTKEMLQSYTEKNLTVDI